MINFINDSIFQYANRWYYFNLRCVRHVTNWEPEVLLAKILKSSNKTTWLHKCIRSFTTRDFLDFFPVFVFFKSESWLVLKTFILNQKELKREIPTQWKITCLCAILWFHLKTLRFRQPVPSFKVQRKPFLTETLINPFVSNAPFLYTLKTSENHKNDG